MDKVQNAAVSDSTHRKDASRLQEYLNFCESLGINHVNMLPAQEDLLMAWATSYAGCFTGKTVGTKISAIRKEHKRRGLPWLGGAQLHQTIKGVEELRPQSSFRPKRAPVSIAMLMDLNKALSRSSGLDICIWAICLLSFFSQLRSGKLLPPTQHLEMFNPPESTAQNGAYNLHLPWLKTQKAHGDDVWIPCQEAPLDPIHAIHKHYIKNKLDLEHPIATHCNTHNRLVTLTRSKFIHWVNHILRATNKGYPCVTGHCFGIGGTTFYLVSGVPPDMVRKFGHWQSQAFSEYWHCLDYLGAIHIKLLLLDPGANCPQQRSLPKA
ncbi:hypothetical protein L208DRAFT_1324579 [Tricholoma matsutake]|nr:hypothetical protein L208DRAFT_1324579 [Tricholoma matsutake 945]